MRGLSKAKRLQISMAASFFLVMTTPFVVYSLLKSETEDDLSIDQVESVAVCTISFPYVNPETVEIGNNIQLEVSGFAPSEEDQINSLLIKTSDNVVLLDKEYSTVEGSITERFLFNRDSIGSVQILGQMGTESSQHPCIINGVKDNLVTTQGDNNAPVFISKPETSASPGNAIKVGQTYSYTLEAKDEDLDNIVYSYSFTPRADWLSLSVEKDGKNGELKFKFQGTPTEAASYLANVFIHDGYNKHLRAQSWVISVSPSNNDTPVVLFTQPTSNIAINKGERVTVSWKATDNNQIVKYRLYYAENPGNKNSWRAIDENISYSVGSYIVTTGQFDPGNYKFILEAEDNQQPPAIGSAVTPEILINATGKEGEPVDNGNTPPDTDPNNGTDTPPPDKPAEPEQPTPDDGPTLLEPQIANLSPEDGETIQNPTRPVGATLIAGESADVDQKEILFYIDEKDVTEESDLTEIKPSEVSIIYNPSTPFESGEHKVSVYFKDTAGNEFTRDWNFFVEEEENDDSSWLVGLLGFDISNRTILIIIIGIGLILLAIIVPWLLYLAWRDNDDTIEPTYAGRYGADDRYPSGGGTYSQYYKPPTQAAPMNGNIVRSKYDPPAEKSIGDVQETERSTHYSDTNIDNIGNTTDPKPAGFLAGLRAKFNKTDSEIATQPTQMSGENTLTETPIEDLSSPNKIPQNLTTTSVAANKEKLEQESLISDLNNSGNVERIGAEVLPIASSIPEIDRSTSSNVESFDGTSPSAGEITPLIPQAVNADENGRLASSTPENGALQDVLESIQIAEQELNSGDASNGSLANDSAESTHTNPSVQRDSESSTILTQQPADSVEPNTPTENTIDQTRPLEQNVEPDQPVSSGKSDQNEESLSSAEMDELRKLQESLAQLNDQSSGSANSTDENSAAVEEPWKPRVIIPPSSSAAENVSKTVQSSTSTDSTNSVLTSTEPSMIQNSFKAEE